MDSDLAGMWVSFFTTAGIPSEVAATYALTFAENRIQNDMLLDLNKEYLRDMGIKRMGDVIAILRHAKQVHENTARDRVLNNASTVNRVPVAAVTGRSTLSQPLSPAGRMLGHYTRNPPTPAQNKRKSDEFEPETDITLKKARLIRFAPPTKSATPEVVSKRQTVASKPVVSTKQTVFSRLGNSESTNTPVQTSVASKAVFGRLGPADALQYEGVLKATPKSAVTITAEGPTTRRVAVSSAQVKRPSTNGAPASGNKISITSIHTHYQPKNSVQDVRANIISKKVSQVNRGTVASVQMSRITMASVQKNRNVGGMHADRPVEVSRVNTVNRIDREVGEGNQKPLLSSRVERETIATRAQVGGMRADETPVSIREKLSLPKAKSVKFSNHVEYKEIEPVQKSLVKAMSKQGVVFNKPERRLSMPEGADGVKARLGITKNVNNLTITRNVFNRLGV